MAFGKQAFSVADAEKCRYFKLLQTAPEKFFESHPSTRKAVKKGEVNLELQDLLLRMLHPEAEQRPTAEQILEHNFIKQHNTLQLD